MAGMQDEWQQQTREHYDGTVGFAGAARTGLAGLRETTRRDDEEGTAGLEQEERLQLRAFLEQATAELNRMDCRYDHVEDLLTQALQYDEKLASVWLLRSLARFELGSSILQQMRERQELIDAGYEATEEELSEMEEKREWGAHCIGRSLEDANRCLDMQPGNAFAFMRKAVCLFFQVDYVLTEQILMEALEKHALDDNLHALMMITKYRLARWKLEVSQNTHVADDVNPDAKSWRAYMEDCVRYSRLAMQNARDYRTAQQGISCMFRAITELSYNNMNNPLRDAVRVVRAVRVYVHQTGNICRVEQVTFAFMNKELELHGTEEPLGKMHLLHLELDEYITRLEGQRDGGMIEGLRFHITCGATRRTRESETYGKSLDAFEGTRFDVSCGDGHHIIGMNWDALRGDGDDEAELVTVDHDGAYLVSEPLPRANDYNLERREYPASAIYNLVIGDEEHTLAFLEDSRELAQKTVFMTESDDPRGKVFEDQWNECERAPEMAPHLTLDASMDHFRELSHLRHVVKLPAGQVRAWMGQEGVLMVSERRIAVCVGRVPINSKAFIDCPQLHRGMFIVALQEERVRSLGDFVRSLQKAPKDVTLLVRKPLHNVPYLTLVATLGPMREEVSDDSQLVQPIVKHISRIETPAAGLEDGMAIRRVNFAGSPVQHGFSIRTDRDLERALMARPSRVDQMVVTVEYRVRVPKDVVEELVQRGAIDGSGAKCTVELARTKAMNFVFKKERNLATTMGAALQGFIVSGLTRGGPGEQMGLIKGSRIQSINEHCPRNTADLEVLFGDARDVLDITVQAPPTMKDSQGRVFFPHRGFELDTVNNKMVRSFGDLNAVLPAADGQEVEVALLNPDWDPVKTFFACPEITLDEDDPRAKEARLPDAHGFLPDIKETLKEITDLGALQADGVFQSGFGNTSPSKLSFGGPSGLGRRGSSKYRANSSFGDRQNTTATRASQIFESAGFLMEGSVKDTPLEQELKQELQFHLVAKATREMNSFGDHALRTARFSAHAGDRGRADAMDEAQMWFENAAHAARLQTTVSKLRNPATHMRLDGLTAGSYCKLANCLMSEDRFAKAQDCIEQAKKFSPIDDSKPTHMLANLLFTREDYAGALEQHRRHQKIEQEAGSGDLEAAALTNLAFAQYVQQDFTSAFANLRTAKDLWTRSRYWTGVVFVLNTLAQCSVQFNDMRNIADGFDYLKHAVAHHTLLFDSTILRYPEDPEMRGRYLRLVQQTYRTLAELMFRAQYRKESLMWSQHGNSRICLDRLSHLIHSQPRVLGMPEGEPYRWMDIANYAKRHRCTVLVFYYMMFASHCSTDQVCTWAITSQTAETGKLRSFITDCSPSRFWWDPAVFVEKCADEIRHNINSEKAERQGAARGRPGGLRVQVEFDEREGGLQDDRFPHHSTEDALSQLFDVLMAPILPEIPPEDETLVIIPHGKLQSLPWSALLADERAAETLGQKQPAPLPPGKDSSARFHLCERYKIAVSHSVHQMLYMDHVRSNPQRRGGAQGGSGSALCLYDASLPNAAEDSKAVWGGQGSAVAANSLLQKDIMTKMAEPSHLHLRVRRTDAVVLTQKEAMWDHHKGNGGALICRQVLRRSAVPYTENVVAVSPPPLEDPFRMDRFPAMPGANQPKGRLFALRPLLVVTSTGDRARAYSNPEHFLQQLDRFASSDVCVAVLVEGMQRTYSWEDQRQVIEDLLMGEAFMTAAVRQLGTGRVVAACASDKEPDLTADGMVIPEAADMCLHGNVNIDPLLHTEERSKGDLKGVICDPHCSLTSATIAERVDLSRCEVACLHSSGSIADSVATGVLPKSEMAGCLLWPTMTFARQLMGADGHTGTAGASHVMLNMWSLPNLRDPERRYTEDGDALTWHQWNQRRGQVGWRGAQVVATGPVPKEYREAMGNSNRRHSAIVRSFWEGVRQRRETPSAALRTAQLAALREARERGEKAHWLSWAGFMVVV